jgi:hypothetical protein
MPPRAIRSGSRLVCEFLSWSSKVRTKGVHRATGGRKLTTGRDLVALGFLLVAAVFVVAIAFLSAATDIATVVAPVTTLVGTLIGAVFGVQVGNEGRERESIARRGAETRAAQAAALVEPERGERLVEMWRDSTANGNPGEEAF